MAMPSGRNVVNQLARGSAPRSRGQAAVAATSADEDRRAIPEPHLALVAGGGVVVDLVAGADGVHEDRRAIPEPHRSFVSSGGVIAGLVAAGDRPVRGS